MSSTNRSDARDSHIADYYITPIQPVKQFLGEFQKNNSIDLSTQDHLILDPCAGGDKDNDMTYPSALFYYGADYEKIITNDIREDSGAQSHVDFLKEDVGNDYDIVISNPPFNLALDFVKRGLEVCRNGGYVIFLLRLNFLGSAIRNKWLIENMPYQIYVHSKRMSFTKDGSTDSIEYAHFVWKKGYKLPTELILLPYDYKND